MSTYTGVVALWARNAHHWEGGFAIFHWFLGIGVEESEKIAVSRGARLRDTCAALHVFRRRCLTPAGYRSRRHDATNRIQEQTRVACKALRRNASHRLGMNCSDGFEQEIAGAEQGGQAVGFCLGYGECVVECGEKPGGWPWAAWNRSLPPFLGFLAFLGRGGDWNHVLLPLARHTG